MKVRSAVKILDGKKFTVVAETKTMVAEISDFYDQHLSASDIIIGIKGRKGIKQFQFDHEVKDAEWETQAWVYKPLDTDLAGWSVHLMND